MASLYVVFQWSIRPEHQAGCNQHLEKIAAHIREEHPEITSTRVFTQWTGPLPRRAYIWLEEYAGLGKLDEGEITPACLEVWKPVEAMAQDGTWTTSVWFDGPEAAEVSRRAP